MSGAPVPSSTFSTGMTKSLAALAEYLFVNVGLPFLTSGESTPLFLLTTTVIVLSTLLSYVHPEGPSALVSFTLKVYVPGLVNVILSNVTVSD